MSQAASAKDASVLCRDAGLLRGLLPPVDFAGDGALNEFLKVRVGLYAVLWSKGGSKGHKLTSCTLEIFRPPLKSHRFLDMALLGIRRLYNLAPFGIRRLYNPPRAPQGGYLRYPPLRG